LYLQADWSWSKIDPEIDEALGYLDFSPTSFSKSLESLAPGLGDFAMTSYSPPIPDEGSESTQPAVQSREFLDSVGQFAVGLGKKVADVVTSAYNAVAGSLSNVSSAVADAINKAIDDIYNFEKVTVEVATKEYTPAVYINLPIDISIPGNQDKNPFKRHDAYLLYNTSTKSGDTERELSLYCLGCGVKGSLHMYGHIGFIIAQKTITAGEVGLSGDITVAVRLGLSASAEYKQKYEKQLLLQGLPGLSKSSHLWQCL
jgi:hypothetical protein